MRVAFFGSGSPMACEALETLASHANVVAVVMPRSAARSWLGRLFERAMLRRFRRICRGHRLPILPFGDGTADLVARLRPFGAELFVVATFPHILREGLLASAPRGALNLHPSLLPRHRGIDPIFWAYFDDESTTGMTVHWIDRRVDAGDVIAQVPIAIERGMPSSQLYRIMCREGAALLADTIAQLDAGTAERVPQDERAATHDPAPQPAAWSIDWQTWSAERVWHFVSGLGDRSNALLPLRHRPPARFTIAPHEQPLGTIEIVDKTLRVYCLDGWVDVARDTRLARMRRLAGWLLLGR